mgnify:CR=1 FL=1
MAGDKTFRIGQLVLPVFLPSLLFATGEGALIPIIPAAAERLGADIPTAGLLAGLFMLGTLLADIPASQMVFRFGEHRSMVMVSFIAAGGIALAYFSETTVALGTATFIAGATASVFGLARHGYMAHNVPQTHRARSLAVLGGMFRGGGFFGPALASLAIWILDLRAVFLVAVLFCIMAGVTLIFAKSAGFSDDKPEPTNGVWEVAKAERHKLITLGSASAILASVRTIRTIGIPLWGLTIHLHPGDIALYIAIAGALDFALFYSSGQVMDRFGRRAAAVPTMLATGITYLFTFIAQDGSGFLVLVLAIALANGIGSGVIMVLGADLAPPESRNEFLTSYRMMVDAAMAGSAPLFSLLIAVVGVAGAMTGFGLLSIFGGWLMYRYIPRFERH